MADDGKDRALDLLVYGPLGLALYVRDTVPTFLKVFVARGRSEMQSQKRKVGDQVSQARSLGELATNFAGPKLLENVEAGLREARQFAEAALAGLIPAGDEASNGEREPVAAPTPAPAPAAVDWASRRAEAASLAIPDYDELSASQVVERLEGLGADELAAVRAYEEAHRGRRTILFKIDQLTS